MKKIIKSFLVIFICVAMVSHSFPVFADSNGLTGNTKGVYMSSAKVFAKIIDENDVIGNAHIICLAQVKEINVNMYLQRGYGTLWQNVTSAYNMNVKDTNEMDESAIIYNLTPGTYRVFIEVTVTGYDNLCDMVSVGTGAFTINT